MLPEFAYLPGRKYDTGMFKGKLAMVATTTGTSAETYAPDGIDGDILDRDMRVNEIANWISHRVLPTRSARGRG